MTRRFLVLAFLPLIAAAQSTSALNNGVYQDKTGVQFTLPPEWVIVAQASSSTPGAHYVKLKNSVTNALATIWIKRRDANAEDLNALMSGRLDEKAIQRNNLEGYKYRPESVQHLAIGGRPALSAVADYVIAGQKMVEYLTWVDGEKSRVVFAGRMLAAELADFQAHFDPVIQSVQVP